MDWLWAIIFGITFRCSLIDTQGRLIYKIPVLASHSETIQKHLWSPVTKLLDACMETVSADTELLYIQDHFFCLGLFILQTVICPKSNYKETNILSPTVPSQLMKDRF